MRAALRRWLVCLSLASSALRPSAALADDVADEADLKFRLGAEAYQRGDFRGALEHFMVSNRLVPNRNVVFNIARCFQELKRFPEAYRYFSLALAAETEPAARANIQRALSQIERQVAVLQVESDPPGATLFVERRDLGPRGNTPTTLGLAPGAYTLLAELPGYYPARLEVPALAAGRAERVVLRLEPIQGSVAIEGRARVRVDDPNGPVACRAPCELKLAAGRHTLFFDLPGHQPSQLEVEVEPKQLHAVRAQLTPLSASVVISSDEPDALIEIDGQPRGFTPAVLSLPLGKHQLRVSLRGYETAARELLLKDTTETRVNVTLTQAEEVTAASRNTERVEDAPSSVSIVGPRELAAMRYPTVAEALRGLPGVYGWNDRSYQAVGFRGLGRLGSYGNRVLVLVDGHPLNDDWLGSSYVGYDARVGLEDVERIEVVRGPGSVLYGTSAFAGVVNLVTRPARTRGGEVGISTTETGVARARVRSNVTLGPESQLWTSAAVARGSGRNFHFPELDAASRGADGFEAGTVEGRYTRRWLSAGWYLQSHHKRLPTGEYETLLGDARTAQTDTRASFETKLEPAWGDAVRTMTRLHANHYRFSGSYARAPADGGVEIDAFHGSWLGLEQRVEIRAARAVELTLGGEGQLHFDVRQQAGDDFGTFLNDSHPYQVGAGYALLDWRPGERFHASAGARLDAYSTFGTSLNPRVALIARPYAGASSKLMLGKAFRAPSVYELYYNDGGFTQIQSPDIEPESIYSAELEHSHRFSPTLSGTAAVFANYVKDLVLSEGSSDASDPLRYANSDAPIGTLGAELGLRRDFRQGYMLALSYSVQRSRFLDGDSPSALLRFEQSPRFRRVANSPEHLASVKGAVPILGRALTLASRLSVESRRFDRYERSSEAPQGQTGAFAIWDVVVSGREERHGFTWAAGVYNAFDWRYSLPVSVEFTQRSIAQDGRTFLLSGELSF